MSNIMGSAPLRIFVSSVQKELATERRAVKDYILTDPMLESAEGGKAYYDHGVPNTC
jgi:hypothetical protein